MNPFEYLRIALETLAQNKVRSALTMLGVIIGVMSVIMLISLGEAAQKYVENEFAGLGSNILIITPGKQETSGMVPIVAGSFRKLTYENAKELSRRGVGIKAVSPVVLGSAGSQYLDRRRNTMVFGVTPAFEVVRNLHVRVGRFLTEEDIDKNNRVCIIGIKLKEELFGTENALNEKVTINRTKHTVIGILEQRGVALGINIDDIIIVPIVSAQKMFHGGEDRLFQIVVRAQSPEDVKAATSSVRSILTAAHDYVEDFTITDQDSILATFGKIFTAMRVMLAGIASISLLVGGIGIMNIMLVSVRERTREVGIRKAVGATNRDVGMQFVVESVTLSSIGGSIGILLAYVGSTGIRMGFPIFPIFVSAWSIVLAFFFSMIVGVFFGAYPAVKAAGVDPVEALRYE